MQFYTYAPAKMGHNMSKFESGTNHQEIWGRQGQRQILRKMQKGEEVEKARERERAHANVPCSRQILKNMLIVSLTQKRGKKGLQGVCFEERKGRRRQG